MYHSLYFTTEDNTNWADCNPLNPSATVFNTFDSWGLITSERPVISVPPVKTNFAESPYASGSIDNTTLLTNVPIYGDRTGSIAFYVTEPGNWPDLMVKLAGYLHGKRLKMWLEDDPEYYYIGRWAINNYGSSNKFSTIQLDYTLYPFKISKLTTTEGEDDWLWDNLNFDNGHILNDDYVLSVNTNSLTKIKTWIGNTNFGDTNRTLTQGVVNPLIKWTPTTSGSTVAIRFVNAELGIDVGKVLYSGTTQSSDIAFSNLTRQNSIVVYANGVGTLEFDMRRLMF